MEGEMDRMKTLLSEAITTLCRNGLKYSEEMSVEGLIGVTLDRKDIFLVSVKEMFRVPEDKENSETRSQESIPKAVKRSTTKSVDEDRVGKRRRKGITTDMRASGESSPDCFAATDDEGHTSSGTKCSTIEDTGQRKNSTNLIVIEDVDEISVKNEKRDTTCDKYQFRTLPSEASDMPHGAEAFSNQSVYSTSSDPRFNHPAGTDNTDKKSYACTPIIKQEFTSDMLEESDQNLSVFTESPVEIIRMPHSLSKASSNPVPVSMNMIPGLPVSQDQTSDNQSEFAGNLTEWPSALSSGGYLPIFEDGATASPQTQQAASTKPGASQQKTASYICSTINAFGKAEFRCILCDKIFTDKSNAGRHVKTKHFGQEHCCPFCAFRNTRSDYVQVHISRKHSDEAGAKVTEETLENS